MAQRGRPKGSKNKPKLTTISTASVNENLNKKSTKKFFKITKFNVILFLILSVLILGTLPFSNKIEDLINPKASSSTLTRSDLVVHFIDVGQADCIAINLPDGKTMLIDAGVEASNITSAGKKAKEKIVDYLNANVLTNGSNVIDYLVLSHSDSDHCWGMPTVLETYQVNTIYRPATRATKDDYETVGALESVNECNTAIYLSTIKAFNDENSETDPIISRVGLTINGEGYSFEFLSPSKDKYGNGINATALNAISSVLLLTYKEKTFLFTGDSNSTNEADMISGNVLSDIDVLKVAHHGSKTSTIQAFLDIVNPEYAVISVGADNTYGLPTSETLERLSGTVPENNILRTDKSGTIIIGVDSSGVIIVANADYSPMVIVWWQVVCGLMCVNVVVCFSIRIKSNKNKKIA